MKQMLSIVLLLLGVVSASESTTYADGSDCNCDSLKREYYESGALMWETPYKNDKKEGVYKGYYKSGALESEVPYKNYKVEGVVNKYYESGKLASRATYKGGTLQGYKECSDGRKGNERLSCY